MANDDATLDSLLTELSSVRVIEKLRHGTVPAVSLEEGAVELILMRGRRRRTLQRVSVSARTNVSAIST